MNQLLWPCVLWQTSSELSWCKYSNFSIRIFMTLPLLLLFYRAPFDSQSILVWIIKSMVAPAVRAICCCSARIGWMEQDEKQDGLGWGCCHCPDKESQNQMGAEKTENKRPWARDRARVEFPRPDQWMDLEDMEEIWKGECRVQVTSRHSACLKEQ